MGVPDARHAESARPTPRPEVARVSSPLRTLAVPALGEVQGLAHGFEQRLGPAGWESREGSRGRVSAALEGSGRLLFLKQVHSAAVRRAPWEGTPEGDAAVADRPGWLLAIETADCLPVLLVDSRRRAVAAAHAGWRGTAARVVGAAIAALIEGGSRPRDILAALGPGIGPCCYEVGGEVVTAFGPGGEAFFRPGPRGRLHLDLRAANRSQLATAGVDPARIHVVEDCTCCRADLYHSFRRDGAGAGRMISYVGWVGRVGG
jgi:purine-nucleoside/S-methyl-5'-thioadenosine phosphorylase / adenosine deaminase